MNHSFLCPRYRTWLLDAPQRAMVFWESWMSTAQSLIASGQWHAAVPCAGNAFETAQLMMGDSRHCSRTWLLRHAASRGLLELLSRRLVDPAMQRAVGSVH